MFIPDIPPDTPHTAKELEQFRVRRSGCFETLSFREEGDRISFMGQLCSPEVHPVHIPQDLDRFGKHFPVCGPCLYRTPGTAGKWIYSERCRSLEIHGLGETVDILFFRSEDVPPHWVRLEATDDPTREDPAENRLQYREEDGGVTVCGASMYCERLHIPAEINGLPVTKIHLPAYRFNQNLRELAVEEGVRQIHMDLSGRFLETIEIPDSVRLAGPPSGLPRTAWFRGQPDGPVYFHGYYCGTKGEPEEDTLVLRDGTVGVIEQASGGKNLKRIIFPDSIRSIGYGAFLDSNALETVDLPPQAMQLRDAFRSFPAVHFPPCPPSRTSSGPAAARSCPSPSYS